MKAMRISLQNILVKWSGRLHVCIHMRLSLSTANDPSLWVTRLRFSESQKQQLVRQVPPKSSTYLRNLRGQGRNRKFNLRRLWIRLLQFDFITFETAPTWGTPGLHHRTEDQRSPSQKPPTVSKTLRNAGHGVVSNYGQTLDERAESPEAKRSRCSEVRLDGARGSPVGVAVASSLSNAWHLCCKRFQKPRQFQHTPMLASDEACERRVLRLSRRLFCTGRRALHLWDH